MIVEVRDLQTGEIYKVKEFISDHRYDEFITLRGRVREYLNTEKCLYVCAVCGTPAYIVSKHNERRFFFRHIKEDGSCSARTRGMLSQDEIRARKYFGQRESEAHKRIKSLVEESLLADPRFHKIEQEKVWRAARNPKSRRQPDVQAESLSFGRIAFEVQLSTTFLNVVVGRRAFYREEGALLIWVLGRFKPEYRRLMTEDILFPNNSNIFVVDDETVQVSAERRAFHMRCFFRRPLRTGAKIVDQWEEQIVAFSELTLDVETQTAFFFDYAGEERRLRDAIAADEKMRQSKEDDELRCEFFTLWEAFDFFREGDDSDHDIRWQALVSTLEMRGIEIPCRHPDANSGFRAMLIGILSAEAGTPIKWKFKKLIEVAIRMFDGHKEHLLTFGFAVQHFKRDGLINEQDTKGTWAGRRSKIREALRNHDPAFAPDTRWLPALSFLFPDIGRSVQAFLERAEQVFLNEIS